MSITREPIDIRVSERTLRFGGESVPLHAITTATTAEIEPHRKAEVLTYALAITRWLIPAAIVAALAPEPVAALVNLGALTWFTVSTARLLGRLDLRLHELRVDTTTGAHRVLVTTDPRLAADLAFTITDTLHDSRLEFHVHTTTVRLATADLAADGGQSADRLDLP